MNNLLSYCGLVDAKIKASDKDLPVQILTRTYSFKGPVPDLEGTPKKNALTEKMQFIFIFRLCQEKIRTQNESLIFYFRFGGKH